MQDSSDKFLQSRTGTCHWSSHNRVNKTPSRFFFVMRRSPGLSGLCVHQLHLHVGGHATPIASLGLHLVLNGADRVHPTEQVTWPHVSCVHEVCGLSIILRSIRRRLLGWGCSAIQQLKHNQNSLMLIVQVINEHQWSFQISTREASQSTLLNAINVQWCQNNNFITSLYLFLEVKCLLQSI